MHRVTFAMRHHISASAHIIGPVGAIILGLAVAIIGLAVAIIGLTLTIISLIVAIVDTATKINKNEPAIIVFGKLIKHKVSGNTVLPPLPNYNSSHHNRRPVSSMGLAPVEQVVPGVVVYLTFTLIYGGILTHSFMTSKLHLKQSGKVPQPV